MGESAVAPERTTDVGRAETPAERYDRNWLELLQELRVLQTGTQILTGFLLAIAFQSGFDKLDEAQRVFYLVLVVLSAISAVMALAPVSLHRFLFRQHAKARLVAFGHGALIGALAIVSLLLVGVVGFVFDVVVSTAAGWIAGSALGILVIAAWFIVPWVVRRESEPGDADSEHGASQKGSAS